jgi:hypothetical protein
MDIGGDDVIRVWTERAGVTFPTVVDAENALGALFGFKVIPNGILIDPHGVVRYLKLGGFEVGNPDDVAAVEHAVRGQQADEEPSVRSISSLDADDQMRVERLLQEGVHAFRRGDREAGLAAWRQALAVDPTNFVIRKQLWRADHPERFGEQIDFAWQKDQLAREKEQEAGTR